ncbi:MAG TPA: SUMF1/EgtB/PvdO family nonheme iron enzyme [Planctomycetota bacterium]|nr:SUMF1/EgtB/PvdO family nonheme iron enzyme [Planctomycetota bacterium]
MSCLRSAFALLLVWCHIETTAADKAPQNKVEPEKVKTLALSEKVKMEFVLVPAGVFNQGSDSGAPNEKPKHKVQITKSFYIAKYPTTVSEFRQFCDQAKHTTNAEKNNNGWGFAEGWKPIQEITWKAPGFAQKDNSPVVLVTLEDARAFADWLSKLSGNKVRLPTESEWEYAARGAKELEYPWGNNWDGKLAII